MMTPLVVIWLYFCEGEVVFSEDAFLSVSTDKKDRPKCSKEA